MINLESLQLNQKYSRPTLAKLWGYKSFNAISRGVFSPQGMDVLIFFVTKEKQESLTQYGYPPDMQKSATITVLKQAEMIPDALTKDK